MLSDAMLEHEERDPFEQDIPAIHCPTCAEKFLRPEDLEVHRERHRPLGKKVLGSARCPKGCGRWLLSNTADAETHSVLCDGSPPINGVNKSMDNRFVCQEHGYSTNGPKGWALHKKEHHGGVDPRTGEASKPPGPPRKRKAPPQNGMPLEQVIGLLRKERDKLAGELESQRIRITGELERLDAAIKALEPKKEE